MELTLDANNGVRISMLLWTSFFVQIMLALLEGKGIELENTCTLKTEKIKIISWYSN